MCVPAECLQNAEVVPYKTYLPIHLGGSHLDLLFLVEMDYLWIDGYARLRHPFSNLHSLADLYPFATPHQYYQWMVFVETRPQFQTFPQ